MNINSINNASNYEIKEAVNSNQIIEDIQAASCLFIKGQTQTLPGTGGLEMIKTNGKLFFGIHKSQQEKLNFTEVRLHVLQSLNLHPETKIVQVVGDSGRFSLEGTAKGRLFLKKYLKEENLLLWGFTGKGQKNEAREVNQLVNDWLNENPARFKKSLANIVDFHTVKAISEWKCSYASRVENFFLVCGNACFGDDIISSDYLTNEALIVEGGIQSFSQFCNFAYRDLAVRGIYNLRGTNNTDCFDASSGQYLEYFSTSEFLDLLKQEIKIKKNMSSNEVEKFKDNYLNPIEGKKKHLFNPSRPDASTKQALWDASWHFFKQHQLWQKLELSHFEKN